MKTVHLLVRLCCCLLAGIHANAQTKQQTFLHLVDPSGKMIIGTSTQRQFEKQIIVNHFSGVVSGNPQLQFVMPMSGATAALASLQGGKQTLPSGVFSVTQLWDSGPVLTYIVRLEDITVVKVEETSSGTSVTLKANRIGTIHYQYDRKTGSRIINGRWGYDFINNSSWNNF